MTAHSVAESAPRPFADFPEEEERIIQFWRDCNAFLKSYELSVEEGRKPYVFYDGPPFATGLPHYGHILASTIKDTVTRFAHVNGYAVERRFGWDTHGLPVEHEIDQKLGITGKEDVMKMGIAKYNAECRSIVMRYAGEWRKTIERMGRWIDFDNDYKTLYPSFMESVWWVFKQLFDKGLVYRGFKVMPYSTGCTTPLSNFEAGQNYKDVTDPSIVVSFPLKSDLETSLLAWTTTPWTLPSNLAVCVNPDLKYVKVHDIERKHNYIVMENRLFMLYKDPKKALNRQYKVLAHYTGKDMEGWEYEPLFDYFRTTFEGVGFKVLNDTYVTDEDGTGIVHQAPAFGEDDYRVARKYGIITDDRNPPCPIDERGIYTSEVTDYVGQYVKDADKPIQKDLKQKGRLIVQSQSTHSYPFCWRSDTPLLYRIVPAWFVRVADHVDKMLDALSVTKWVPTFVQEKRFANWIGNAQDWNISRNRYWGTPLPLWVSDDFSEIVCIGSIGELEELSGVKGINDLHRDSIDHITIPSKSGKGTLKRIEEVFDCWFESGSMPYASKHYPFESKGKFETEFPAQFIAEGLDQTRGWFYTLLILGVHLFGKAPFENVVVNGIVLAEDGKKMSKRLKNYPEPDLILKKYGADAVRLYMINSPVVRAETLKFKEDGVREIVSSVLIPWKNSFIFFEQQTALYKKFGHGTFVFNPDHPQSTNSLDRWIMASAQSLIVYVKQEMNEYRLYTVVPKLLHFLDDLSNVYIRLNRPRLKGGFGKEDTLTALNVLFDVLFTFVRTMSSFAPFMSENIYLRLRPFLPASLRGPNTDSVHFLLFPEVKEEFFDEVIQRKVRRMSTILDLTRYLRESKALSFRVPLQDLIIVHKDQQYLDDVKAFERYIKEELRLEKLTFTTDEDGHGVVYKLKVDWPVLGKKLKKDMPKVKRELSLVSSSEVKKFLETKSITVAGITLGEEDLQVTRDVDSAYTTHYIANHDNDVLVLLDPTVTDYAQSESVARECINRVQKLRKKAGLQTTDDIRMEYKLFDEDTIGFSDAITRHEDMIAEKVRGKLLPSQNDVVKEDLIIEEEATVANVRFLLRLLKL